MKTETKLLFIASGLLAAAAVGFMKLNKKIKKKKNEEIFQEGVRKILDEQGELSNYFDKKDADYSDTFLDLLRDEEIPWRRKLINDQLAEFLEKGLNWEVKLRSLERITYLDFSKEKKISCPNTLLEIFKKELDECAFQYNEAFDSTEIWFEAWKEVFEEEEERE